MGTQPSPPDPLCPTHASPARSLCPARPPLSCWCSPALPASAVSRVTWVAGPAASYSGSSVVPPEQGRGKGRQVAGGRIPRLPQRRESGLGIAHPGHAARVSAPAPPATVSQPEPSAVTLLARSSGGRTRRGQSARPAPWPPARGPPRLPRPSAGEEACSRATASSTMKQLKQKQQLSGSVWCCWPGTCHDNVFLVSKPLLY